MSPQQRVHTLPSLIEMRTSWICLPPALVMFGYLRHVQSGYDDRAVIVFDDGASRPSDTHCIVYICLTKSYGIGHAGQRNRASAESELRKLKLAEQKAIVAEKQETLERLNAEYESLVKVKQEQEALLARLQDTSQTVS